VSISYSVRRHPRARRLKLRVRRDGSVQVTAPKRACRSGIQAFVDEAGPWIRQRRAALDAQRLPAAERGPFPVRLRLDAIGRLLPVTYATADAARWRFGRDALAIALVERQPEAARRLLVDALKSLADRSLTPRLLEWAERGKLQPSSVRWRNQKSRWGSCSSRGGISLNVRLLFLEPDVVDYVLVHELAHLDHPDHSPAFHARVASLLPRAGVLRRRLKTAGDRVPDWILEET
jgi:hypothetical protein